MNDACDLVESLSPVRMLLEIGCWRMDDTRRLRSLFPTACIHAFEPDPRNVDYISKHHLADEMHIYFHPIALGSHDAQVDFWPSLNREGNPKDEWTMSGSLLPPRHPGNPCFSVSPIRVKCRTLDSFCDEHSLGEIDLIWMDVQGAELLVIQGGRKTLDHTRWLMTEHHTAGVYKGASTASSIHGALPNWRLLEMRPYDMLLQRER